MTDRPLPARNPAVTEKSICMHEPLLKGTAKLAARALARHTEKGDGTDLLPVELVSKDRTLYLAAFSGESLLLTASAKANACCCRGNVLSTHEHEIHAADGVHDVRGDRDPCRNR